MIIALPNDGRGLLYHILDLRGQTVHAYRDFDAAIRAREGDQRIAILQEPLNGLPNRWLTDVPAPDRSIVRRPSIVPDLQGTYGPELYFDPQPGADWPEGCWACRIPECDTYFGATPDAALAVWEAAQ